MPVIEVRNLRKTYGSTVAVDDVGFTVDEGEIFGILGPNGAGKSTTVECLTGGESPDSGEIRILGRGPQEHGRRRYELIGYQMQTSALPATLRVHEAVTMFSALYPNPRDAAGLLDAVGMTADRKKPFGALSGGQKQRLSVALALIGSPRIAVLDELTTGLDPEGRRDTWELIRDIRASGVTIVLVTHSLDEAERLCDRLTVIDRGRTTITATPGELIEATGGGSLEDAYLNVLNTYRRIGKEQAA
ncbi:ABC transporter ATP-binding protein [Actinoplanes sp. N902-109]|uniref:ABC transporter ATP-binding protein n=1 Tax=Actinoplanes sp. (strain N902-109) TaxID=649831 RepID=UPI00039B27E6|nr:ABC transporter ATP-binding protein [Actinoplanes sp. N902-109]